MTTPWPTRDLPGTPPDQQDLRPFPVPPLPPRIFRRFLFLVLFADRTHPRDRRYNR